MRYFFLFTVLLLFFTQITSVTLAQSLPENEVNLTADGGIDWDRDQKFYRAYDNAMIVRGNLSLRAEEITAYYKEEEGVTTTTRIDAVGKVELKDLETQAYGDKAVYHFDSDIVVLIGHDLKMVNQQGVITARDSLEYWNTQKIGVARGEATIVQPEGDFIRAGALTAFIDADNTQDTSSPNEENNLQNSQISRIDATDGVHMSTKEEIIIGDEGVYLVPEKRMRLCGNVRITRGQNQLNGDCANVNMETGKSQIEGGGNKVKGIFLPSGEQ